MNKNVLIGIVVAVVVVLGGVAAYMYMQPKDSRTSNQSASQNGGSEVSTTDFGNYFTDGGTRKCTSSQTTDTMVSSGTFYFDSNRSVTEVKMTMDGKDSTVYQIYKDEKSYTWEEGSTTGIIVKASTEELKKQYADAMAKADTDAQQQAQSAARDVKITCENWNVDESKFTPPSNIEFREVAI